MKSLAPGVDEKHTRASPHETVVEMVETPAAGLPAPFFGCRPRSASARADSERDSPLGPQRAMSGMKKKSAYLAEV